jgi:hypothetical protein
MRLSRWKMRCHYRNGGYAADLITKAIKKYTQGQRARVS